MSSWAIRRTRPALRARRTAISRWRPEPRAKRRFARLTQPISSTNPTAAKRTKSSERALPVRSCCTETRRGERRFDLCLRHAERPEHAHAADRVRHRIFRLHLRRRAFVPR